MRTALVLALFSMLAWGVGSVLLKRVSDTVSPTSFIVAQYLVGFTLVGGWIVASGGASAAFRQVESRRAAVIVAALFLAGGYLLFIAA